MDIALSRRVGQAFLIGRPTGSERQQLLAACQKADTFTDLPKRDRELVEDLERRGGGRTVVEDEQPDEVPVLASADGGLVDTVLGRRVGHAFAVGNPTPAERMRLTRAAQAAATYVDMDPADRRLLRELEQREPDYAAQVAADEPGEYGSSGMVALIPTPEHAARLAVDGGTPADELHCTLAYLGEIGLYPDGVKQRITDALTSVAGGIGPFGADAFSVCLFNPDGDEPCVVLGLTGELIAEAALIARDLVTMATAPQAPDQHVPFYPHITLIYGAGPSDVAGVVDRVGPVVFDRLRLAWGDEITDIPLTPPDAMMSAPVDEPVDEVEVEEVEVEEGDEEFAAKPNPVDDDDDEDDYHHPGKHDQKRHGRSTGPKYDRTRPAGSPRKSPLRWSEDAEVAADVPMGAGTPWEGVIAVEGQWTGDGRMFAPGSLTWDGVLPQSLKRQIAEADGHDGSVVVGRVDEIVRDGPLIKARGVMDDDGADGAEAVRLMTKQMARLVSVKTDSTGPGDLEEIPYEQPEPAALEKLGQPAINTDQASDVEYVAPVGDQPSRMIVHKARIRSVTLVDESAFAEAAIGLLAGQPAVEETVVVASGYTITIPELWPEEWFAEPEALPPVGAMHITPEGRVYGLIAPSDVPHRAFARQGQVVTARRGANYQQFMNKPALVRGADGAAYRINAGSITFDCGHLSPYDQRRQDPTYATQHYDNSCSIFARVRCGENAYGTWFAGALLHGVDADAVERAMGCALSGDWQGDTFNAALLVPVEGYPVAQTSSVRYRDDVLVAAMVPVVLDQPTGPLADGRRVMLMERAAAVGHTVKPKMARLALRREALR